MRMLFFIVMTLISVNLYAYMLNNDRLDVMFFVRANAIEKCINSVIWLSIIIATISIVYGFFSLFDKRCYVSSFLHPGNVRITICLVLYLVIFYAITFSCLDRHVKIVDLFIPFIGIFYYWMHSFVEKANDKKVESKTIDKDALDFKTNIDGRIIKSKESLKELASINEVLIPMYNDTKDMLKSAISMNSHKNKEKLVKEEEKIKEKINMKVEKIIDLESEFYENELSKDVDKMERLIDQIE